MQSTLPDGYLSLQTGVYDGWLMFLSAYLGFKFYEPSPNYTLIGFGAMGVNALTMNQRKFDSLPEEVQTILVDVGRAYEEQAGASLNARQESGLKGLAEVGANIKELGEEARKGWAVSMDAFPNRQAKDADGRGMPGTEVMNAYLKAVADTGYTWPHVYTIE